MNGDEKQDAPKRDLPYDGEITWVKGRVEGRYVYGVMNEATGNYEYECRYDEGPGDREWMEECDRNYLARLEREGRLQQVEPEIWAQRQKAEQESKEKAMREEKAQRAREAREKEEREQKERQEREAKELAEQRRQKELAEYKAIKEQHDKRIAAQSQKEHQIMDAKLEAKLDKYRCSITALVMLDPVIAADGITYEREKIEEWLEKHDTSPKTNLILANKTLTPNVMAREIIQELLADHPELWDSGEVCESLGQEVKFVRAVKNHQLNELKAVLSTDKRLVKIPIENQKSLLSFALEQKSVEMAKLAISVLGKDIQHIPELEAKEGAQGLFRKAVVELGTEGAKLVGDALGMKQVDYQKELWHGIQHSNTELIQGAIELKADPAELNPEGLLLAKHGQIDNVDAKNQTALHRAIIRNKPDQVRLLSNHGADVRKATPQGLTPLELSVDQIRSKAGSLKIAEVLLEQKADPNVTDAQGQTLFLKALGAGMSDVMSVLVTYGVNLNQANTKGEIPLHQAFLFHGKELESILSILVKGRIDLEAKDSHGKTALFKAVETNQAGAVEVLLNAKANKEAVDANGNTALHIAAEKGFEPIVRLLLEAGANPETRNSANKKPLHLAKQANQMAIVDLLRAKSLERRMAPFLQPMQNQIAELKRRVTGLEQENVLLRQTLAKTQSASNGETVVSSTTMSSSASAASSSSSFWSQSSSAYSSSSMSAATVSAASSSTFRMGDPW